MSNTIPSTRTFTFRALAVGCFAMLVLAFWVQFHEVLIKRPNIIAENSPPAAAVGIIVGVVLVAAAVTRLRPRLRLTSGELVVIYAMLVTSAPLMSQGMWHRFLGLIVAIPHNTHNHPIVDSFSEKLWPHGEHLVEGRRFAAGVPASVEVEPTDAGHLVDADASPVGAVRALELVNADDMIGTNMVISTLRVRLPRYRDQGESIVPGERYYMSALVRLRDMSTMATLSIALWSDGGEEVPIKGLRRDTDVTFSQRGAFVRTGEPYVVIPRDTEQYIDLLFTLEGRGKAAVTDVVFFNNEAIARLHKGSSEVRASDLARLPDNQRDSLVVRPDRLLSPAGVAYLLKGYVPYRAWLRPLAYWLSIVLAVFLCLLGISVIFRRQWADNERFSFPLIVVPRLLLEQKDADGSLLAPIFRKRTFKAGLIVATAFCIMQGLAFYVPGLPDPTVRVDMAEFFASPATKAFMRGMGGSNFSILWLYASIAFFVDLEMLLSILILFWAAKLPYYFGEVFGWKAIKGPMDDFPFTHEQHIGAFLGLAGIVLWVSRKHLLAVSRCILGKRDAIDDSGEAMSYRAAALMILLSFAFFAVWGHLTGLGAGSSLLFFGFIVICGLSASRIRTECGAPATYFTPYYPYLIFFLLGGLHVFGTQTLLLAYVAGGFMAVAQFLMFAPTQVEMLHLGNQFNAEPHGIRWGLVVGALGGLLLGGYVMLVWAYGVGGENIDYMRNWGLHQDWYLKNLRAAVADADSQVRAALAKGTDIPTTYPTAALAAVGAGTGITVLLTVLRARFVGFWLHPIGYVLANTHFVYGVWGSLLTAWIIKLLGLKIGGPRLIREHMTPFFVGIFCGCVLGMLFWDLIALGLMARGVQDVFCCLP